MSGEPSRLGRQLDLRQTTAVALGAMIGAGVYVSMGEAARTTGGSLLLAVLLGAVVATLNGLSSAELGANDPQAGGAYQFGRRLVHPLVGFMAGWLFLLAALAASATYALTFGAYLRAILPGVSPHTIGVLLVLAATALNSAGVRPSVQASIMLVGLNIAVLIAFVVLALPAFDIGRLQPFLAGGITGLLQSTALLFFAYSGYARPVTIAEEVLHPRTILPRAVTSALGITVILYLGIALAALGALGPTQFGAAEAPLRAAMEAAGTPVGAALLSIGALIATTVVLITEIWGLSRLAFAMARNHDLPAWLGHINEKGRIPRRAILSAGALLAVLVLLVDLRPALEASSLGLLIYYGVMNLSALRLSANQRLYPPIVPILGLAACLAVSLSLPASTLLAVLAAALAGLFYYAVVPRR